MAKKEVIEILKIIIDLFEKRGINIYKIVIFGSYAKGIQGKESDIDLIIVSKDFINRDIFKRVELTGGIHRELVRMLKKPFDIMYYSDEEWNEGNSLIINSAKQEGEVIFG